MAIDLSKPSAFEREATGVGSVQQLLSGIANIEKKRQDRNTLNQISQARALNPEASLDEIIASISSQGTQFDEGIAGFIQRFASGAGGQGTVLPELQARSITQPTTTLSPAERAKAERVKAGLLPRAGTGTTTKPTQATPEEKDRDRNAAVIERELKKKNPRQGLVADATKRLLESTVLRQIELGGFDDAFQSLIDELKPEVTRRQGFLGIGRDKVFGQETFDELLESATLEGLKDGIDPKSIEAALLEWWNRQADKEEGQEFQKFERIETGQPGPLPTTGGETTRKEGESVADFIKRTGT